MFIVISYDIPDDRRRGKLAKLLESYGQRVQYSVFECILSGRHLRDLRTGMMPLLNLREDSVRFYFLSKAEVAQIKVVGQGGVTKDAASMVV